MDSPDRQAAARLETSSRSAVLAVAMAGAVLLRFGVANAQEVGTIAGVEPEAEIGRAGGWTAASLGSTVQVGDALRTGPTGRLRVVFRDESVVNLAGDTELTVDEQVFDPAEESFATLMGLVRGKMRALVSDYYRAPKASFRVETETAVAGARGTDFVVLYDEAGDVTEVVGVAGLVAVQSPMALAGAEVVVGGHELSSVARGKLPTAPLRLDEALFRQYLDGLEFAGAGRAESLALGLPISSGGIVPEDDRAHVVLPQFPSEGWPKVPGDPPYDTPDVSSLIGDPPASVIDPGGLGVRF